MTRIIKAKMPKQVKDPHNTKWVNQCFAHIDDDHAYALAYNQHLL